MSRRKGAEFSKRIKEAERLKWHKNNPNKRKTKLQVHHICGVADGRRLGVPDEALRSQLNAVAVTEAFHQLIHRETDEETKIFLANVLINLWRKLFYL